MFHHLIIFALLLSLKPALGSQNDRPVAAHIHDDEEITKLQHQIELLKSENENLRLRLEISNDRLDRHLAEINKNSNQPPNTSTNSGNANCKKCACPTSCLNLAGGHQVIQVDKFGPDPFLVVCDNVTQGGGWTVIQRRTDGTVDFYRNWAEYKEGFGKTREFFIGLEKLHALTTTSENELLIVMRDKNGVERFAKYDAFAIGSESEGYALNVLGAYSGNAGDSLRHQQSGRFRTKDNDSPTRCAVKYTRGWWELDYGCKSSLNGKYGDDTTGKGIIWQTFHGFENSLPYVQMMIRPKSQ